MNFIPIQESDPLPVSYGSPPLVIQNRISLCNSKGKKYYDVYSVKISKCLHPTECIHHLTIHYVEYLFTQTDHLVLVVDNVKYEDIKNKGYLPFIKPILMFSPHCNFSNASSS